MIKNIYFNSLTIILLLTSTVISAQKAGNIVEVFGKDKNEYTYEGVVLQQFTEGLVLRNAIRPGLLTGSQDFLFWQLATGNFKQPRVGQIIEQGFNLGWKNKGFIWETIKSDSLQVFNDMPESYLYTEYNSDKEQIVLLDATGHTRIYINGQPHEGDHYDFGYTLIPFKLKKGLNQFIYTYGRFERVISKIVIPDKPVQLSPRDLTLPSLILGETNPFWGAVRLVNADELFINNFSIECILETGNKAVYKIDAVMPLSVRKVKFIIPTLGDSCKKEVITAKLILKNAKGLALDTIEIKLNVKQNNKHHERTFVSNIDGSVQYYSVVPSTSNAKNQAFILSVHGASVEAVNQSRAYEQKDWGYIIAPTNRRPFGFNWEEWGRIDALEVMTEARKLFHTDPYKTYLTGHSMGGHGTYFLGATYPDKWAAIAPAAGYPDIIKYRLPGIDTLLHSNPHFDIIGRAASPGRVLKIARNYLQLGVYILHGSADDVVPPIQAREMRSLLGSFHNNFTYYEYPGGTHWYGNHCMDWPPLFNFLKQNIIPHTNKVDSIEFYTASPGVSADNYWISVIQQIKPLELSSVKAVRSNDTITLKLENIAAITLKLSMLDSLKNPTIAINNQYLNATPNSDLFLKYTDNSWVSVSTVDYSEKHPDRYAGFKSAFNNNVVFVYATKGNVDENSWYQNKARFDAETFLYRGNGSIDVIPDNQFSLEKYKNRNVIIYGNANNNAAWNLLLKSCPVQVRNNEIVFGDKTLNGDNLGSYLIYPRSDSNQNLIGVIAGTGIEGMKALYANDYFSGITGFPDVLIFTSDWIKESTNGIKISGFFGNDWSIKNGDFQY